MSLCRLASLLVIFLCLSLHLNISHAQVRVGADVLLSSRMDLLAGKRVGLVTNHSALLADGRHLADALAHDARCSLVALFGPEHGIRGDAPDGRTVHDTVDARTGVPAYSLYGRINKPTDEMLRNVDVLVYDIQDVGVRFYTFESTLFLAMESAAEHHLPIIVLDRPNPIRGVQIEGPVRADSLRSFVGWAPVPVSHGLTVGELALMANGEGWLADRIRAQLTVVPMAGWTRTMWYDETGLRWVKPSPNMATLQTAVVYPGTCLFEGTNLSEGRGTEHPFEWLGAPFMDGERWAAMLNGAGLPGVRFAPVRFVPRDIPGTASNVKFRGVECRGVSIEVTNRNMFEPFRTALWMLAAAKAVAPDSLRWRSSIDRLAGRSSVRLGIAAGEGVQKLLDSWESDRTAFVRARTAYLLYH